MFCISLKNLFSRSAEHLLTFLELESAFHILLWVPHFLSWSRPELCEGISELAGLQPLKGKGMQGPAGWREQGSQTPAQLY